MSIAALGNGAKSHLYVCPAGHPPHQCVSPANEKLAGTPLQPFPAKRRLRHTLGSSFLASFPFYPSLHHANTQIWPLFLSYVCRGPLVRCKVGVLNNEQILSAAKATNVDLVSVHLIAKILILLWKLNWLLIVYPTAQKNAVFTFPCPSLGTCIMQHKNNGPVWPHYV